VVADGRSAVILRPSSQHADEFIGTDWHEIDEDAVAQLAAGWPTVQPVLRKTA